MCEKIEKMNPVLTWEMESDGDTLKILVRTTEKALSACFEKSYLYKYQMQADMREREPYRQIDLYIDSRGGDWRSACGIFDALKAVPGWIRIRTLVTGQCASAATVLLGLRGPAYIVPDGCVFIHRGSAVCRDEEGTRQPAAEARILDGVGEILESGYRRAMRKNLPWWEYMRRRHVCKVWTAGETSFSADDAVRAGLVTGVLSLRGFERGVVLDVEKRRKRARIAALNGSLVLIFAAVLLIGIYGREWERKVEIASRPEVTSGTIVEKIYHPEQESVDNSHKMTRDGFQANPLPIHRDECWALRIRSDDGYEAIWVVKQELWERMEVGKRVRKKGAE